jgi:hypothetical protein
MKRNLAALLGGVATMALFAEGCAVQTSSADAFKEPIPQASDVALRVPGSATASGTTAQVQAQELRIQGGSATGATSNAEFYQFTRNVTDGVDWGTVVVLGVVDLIVSLPPTTIDANHAVWGPGNGDALDPVVWRFTVTDQGNHAYSYELDGRPHTSTSEADFRAVLTGVGYGASRPEHRSGWFLIDNDAAAALDPSRNHDNGTVKVTFDARSFPITIEDDIKHTADPDWFDVVVAHNQDTSGTIDIHAFGDVDTPPDGSNENVTMRSEWNSQGAGRADVDISGGNYASGVTVTECWDATFTRSYYTDSINYQPTSGSPSSCAFAQPPQ